MTEIHRRHSLYLAGIGMAALAGCSESSSDEPGETDTEPDESEDGAEEGTEYEGTIETGELPSYASVLPDTDGSEYFYTAVDIETLNAIRADDDAESGEQPTDPIVTNSLNAVQSSLNDLLAYASESAAWGAYDTHDETPEGAGVLVYVNSVYAIVGDFDLEGLETALEDEGYVASESGDAYGVYSRDADGDVVGVSDEVFAFPDPNASATDSVAAIRELVETAAGQREPKHAVDEDFEWLLRVGGNSGITTTVYTDADEFDPAWLGTDQPDDGDGLESDYTPFEGSNGAHQQFVVTDEEDQGRVAVTYADEDRVDVDRLESSLGTDAESVDVTRDGTAVAIDAEYGDDL